MWFYIGMAGGILFILLQLLLLIDFAHIWNANWISGVDSNKCWYFGEYDKSSVFMLLLLRSQQPYIFYMYI